MNSNIDWELQQRKKAYWKTCFLTFMLLFIFCLNLAGLFLGSVIYEETSIIFSQIKTQNRNNSLQQLMNKGTTNYQWENVTVSSPFGYLLSGTFIPNAKPTHKTIIFLHGFTENRTIGLYYLEIYLRAGFNVLLVDSRAHGESGGDSVTWGSLEKYDLEQWVNWLAQRIPNGAIGVHGLSMGAATALLHAELNEKSKRVAFYVADSPYSDFETLLSLYVRQYLSPYMETLNYPRLANLDITSLLLPYANLVSYFHSRSTFHEASPLQSVRHVTTPILYLHGEADTLIPASMSLELQQATKGPSQLYLFANSKHGTAIFDNHRQYSQVIQHFLQTIGELG